MSREEKYDEALNRLIRFSDAFLNIKDLREWFKKNYSLFGFKKLLSPNEFAGDYYNFVCEDFDGKTHKVEVEQLASDYFLHKHKRGDVDMVVCLVKDTELPIESISLINSIFKASDSQEIDALEVKVLGLSKILFLPPELLYKAGLTEFIEGEKSFFKYRVVENNAEKVIKALEHLRNGDKLVLMSLYKKEVVEKPV